MNRCAPIAVDAVRLRRRDLGREIGAGHRRATRAPGPGLRRGRGHGRHPAAHRAPLAQVPGQRAGVDAADADDALRVEFVGQSAAGAPGRGPAGRIAHHVAGDPDAARLGVLVVDAGVADVRRGLHDDLPVVGRVGQRLLVAGHPGGEHRLAERLAERAVRLAVEGPAVLQDQDRILINGHRSRGHQTGDRPHPVRVAALVVGPQSGVQHPVAEPPAHDE